MRVPDPKDPAGRIDDLLALLGEGSTAERQRDLDAIDEFIRQAVQTGQTVAADFESTVRHWVAAIDRRLSLQLAEVLHHPDFQRLEGAWRGLHSLVRQTDTAEDLR